jgi:hypothetical protein
MHRKVSAFVGIVAVGMLLCGPAMAQSSSPSEKLADIKKMTVEQWEKLEAKFKQEHNKWEGCEAQAKEKKIEARSDRWSYLYDCMMK